MPGETNSTWSSKEGEVAFFGDQNAGLNGVDSQKPLYAAGFKNWGGAGEDGQWKQQKA